ncbi:phage tail tape measure protein [Metabacillus indicus]|uniref:phage tail tape measure protein n=1 Tax=Metabacillus indicus TaxID=246786 RepID=UPI002A01CBAF|nr:phage tail tape measure protein [Metabacillus indicus]MDX8288832.1 phage tail tape measure protein [Metabacillus indicus]
MERIEGLSINLALDATSMTRGLKGLKEKLKDVTAEMTANMSVFDRNEQSVEKYETRLSGLNRKLDVQREVTQAAREEYDRMVQQHGEGSVQADRAARAFNNEVAALNNLERFVNGVTEEFEEFQRELEISESSFGRFSETLEQTGEKFSLFGEGMSNVGAGMSASITAPIIGIGAAALTTAMEVDNAAGIIQAKLGMTAEESAELEEIAKNLWKNGFGENVTAAGEALTIVSNNMLDMPIEQLESAAEKAYILQDAFGLELAASTAIADQMMLNFGLTADEAFDTLTTGYQNGLDYGADFADTIQEYGPIFAEAGMDANDMLSFMETAQAAGFRNLDVAADTFKEFTLLSSEGSEEFAGAVAMMGKETQALYKGFQDGKVSGEELFYGISSGLKNIEDPTKRFQAGVLTMGTMFEDNTENMVMNMTDFRSELETVNGATAEAGDALYDNLGAKATSIFRGFQTDLLPVGEVLLDLAEEWLPKVADFLGNITGKFASLSPEIQKNIVMFGGIGAALGPVIFGIGVFISLIGGIMTALAPVASSIAQAGGLLKWIRLGLVALTGPVGITIGVLTLLGTGFITLYRNSETFRNGVNDLIARVKALLSDALAAIQPAIASVVQFFKDQLAVIQKFWKENSDVIMNALSNVGSFLLKVFNGIVTVIQFVMPLILTIIKSVWGNIKGVITGALDVIMGAIKVFSGLFTGDFDKMWEGLKQMFSGAITFIWNFIQLNMFGKLLVGAKAFFTLFRSGFTSLWAAIKSIFSTVINGIVNFVKGSWSKLNSITTSYFNTMRSFYVTIWNAISKIFTTVVKGIFDFVKRIWSNLSSNTSTIFNTIKNAISNVWNSIKSTITNLGNGIWNSVKSTWSNILNSTKSSFRNVYDAVKSQFDNIINRAKELPGKIGAGIGNMAGKVKEGVNKVINNMAGTLGKGVNGVIGGVNWVLGKIGVDNKVPEWKVPQYAKGTDNHPGGPAVVGEKGRELAHIPGTGYTMLGDKGAEFLNLPKGTSVLPNKETELLLSNIFPAYAKGKGWLTSAWDGAKNAVGKVKDTAFDVWSYISDPGKLFKKALEMFGVKTPSLPGVLNDFGKGAFTKVKDSMKNFFKEKIEGFGGSMGAPPGKGVARWRNVILQAAARMQETLTNREVNGILAQIQRESGGNEKIIQSSAVWDVNTAAGNPARGLLQYIPQTFNAYKMKGHNNIYSGYDQLLAFFNNKTWRRDLPYGKRGWGPRGGRKFESGGIINSSGLYELAEGGFPEFVIPTDPKRRTDAMKLLALAGKQIQGNKRPHQLPNAGRGNDNDSLLQAVLEQNKILMALLQSNRNIESKPVISEGDIGRAAERYDSRQSSKHAIFNGRAAF